MTKSNFLTRSLLASFMAFNASLALAQTSNSSADPSAAAPAGSTDTATKPEDKPLIKTFHDWAGDVRLRSNYTKDGAADARFREQLRVRLGFKADVDENITAVIRLSTLASAISGNQTLGDNAAPGMQKRFFGLDQGMLEYRPFTNTAIWAGRTPNPFYSSAKNQLVFDADLNFEGLSAKYQGSVGSFDYFANLGTSMIAENYLATGNDLSDVSLVGAQLGAAFKGFGTWTGYVSTYNYLSVQGHTVASVVGANSPAYGNSTVAGVGTAPATIGSKFQIFEAGLSWKYPWSFAESEIFFDSAVNNLALAGGSAYEGGALIKFGKIQLGYARVSKAKDSVVGAFTDSDTNGGGVDNVGGRASISYQASKNASITLTDYRGERNSSTTATNFGATHLDFMGSF